MDIRYFSNKLKSLENDLTSQLNANEQIGVNDTVKLDQQSTERLSRMDAMQTQQMDLEQQRRLQRQLTAIHMAQKRIAEDDFGYCIQCGEDISFKRLDANPCIVKCINCAK